MICKIDECGSSDGNEDVGSKASASLPVLPLGPDQGPEHERSHEAASVSKAETSE
jgi:hypothetical protein